MAVPQNQHRQLSRLHIPGPLGPLTMGRGMDPTAPMFTPGIGPGGVPPNFAYSLNTPNPLQTPMQTNFFAQQQGPPPMNRRPSYAAHGHRMSLAQMPPQGALGLVPSTPGQSQFPPHMMINGQPAFTPPFPGRNRRAPSISTGGPPKAVLGGPGRNHSPMPVVAAAATAAAAAQQAKRKVAVNLPKEAKDGDMEDGERKWAAFVRNPVPLEGIEDMHTHPPMEMTSCDIYPADKWRKEVPNSVDVFLPGKSQWEVIKRAEIDEKLQQLGIEKTSGSNVPHIHAPHARAASISSPADPALLLFKLNKLHASQQGESSSTASSPQPPHQTPSPNPLPPRLQGLRGGHGQSQSLSQASTYQLPSYNPTAAFNPFGPAAILGSDQIRNAQTPPNEASAFSGKIFAPQGRVPTSSLSLAPPTLSRPSSRESRPDFLRGFGLDIPEEDEEGVEELEDSSHISVPLTDEVIDEHNRLGKAEDEGGAEESEYQEKGFVQEQYVDEDPDAIMSTSHSRRHSRHISHVSRISVALSLRSLGGQSDPGVPTAPDEDLDQHVYPESAVDEIDNDVADWTGSSDDEGSIGEYSNPSDEERARQERAVRRIRRRMQQKNSEVPRSLPRFPQPPVNTELDMEALRRPEDEVSNPSDEGYGRGPADAGYFPASAVRPLPPVPLPNLDEVGMYPAGSQRRDSNAFFPLAPRPIARTPVPQDFGENMTMPMPAPAGPPLRRDSLNPFAKPFVFGSRPSGSWSVTSHPGHQGQSSQGSAQGMSISAVGHARAPSMGKTLNAAAAEFVPTSFTFRPPAPAPPMPAPRPLPEPPTPGEATHQMSNKRMKRASSVSDWGSEEGVDAEGEMDSERGDFDGPGHTSFESFKFPAEKQGQEQRRSAPASPVQRPAALNVNAKPFTFSNFTGFASMPVPHPHTDVPSVAVPPGESDMDLEARTASAAGMRMPIPRLDTDNGMGEDDGESYLDSASPTAHLSLPHLQQPKARRAPIPLDFKHPVSTNMVPAGLFKALSNAEDDRTRATVRSRLSSREYLEHASRPSLDDASVLSISRQKSNGSRLTNASKSPNTGRANEPFDIFNTHAATTNQPDRRHSGPQSHASSESIISMDVAGKRALDAELLSRFESHIEEKLDHLQRVIDLSESSKRSSAIATEAMVSEVLSLFRTQMHQTAAQSLDDSTAQVRSEMDFEIFKDIVQQSQEESNEKIGMMVSNAMERIRAFQMQIQNTPGLHVNVLPFLEDISSNITNTILSTATNLATRLDNLNGARPSSATERDLLLRELMASLTPLLNNLRPEPIDYEGLTHQLTQAVKPHISQLIDLASDKRETATLIVNSLRPILPTLIRPSTPTAFDTEAIISQLKADIHSIVAPLDAHVIKEQVADLVVERIDSRLAVRDRAFSPDMLSARVSESVGLLLEPVQQILSAISNLSQSQQHLVSQNLELTTAHQNAQNAMETMSTNVSAATEAMHAVQAVASNIPLKEGEDSSNAEIAGLGVSVEHLVNGQEQVTKQIGELLKLHEDILERVMDIPEAVDNAAKALQSAHVDIIKRAPTKQEADELRKLTNTNTDLQVQLTKARGAHGQARVEKDHLTERLQAIESDRERLRGQVETAQQAEKAKASEAIALEARNAELEEALAQALTRLKASDVTAQTNQERIAELEKSNREISQERQSVKSKVESLELQARFAKRDKEAAEQALALVQKDRDHLASQQTHWDDLRRTAEQLENLSNLVGKMDDEEVRELQRIRDRSKVLEGEHAALQKRFREQDSKIANAEKSSLVARQNLAQAKERASEWEKRAKETESELESMRSKLDQAEETNAQLDADYSLAKLQLEERATEERATKDRESKLKDQVASLDGRITKLQAELDQAQTKAAADLKAAKQPSRPDSRSSTVYIDSPDRATTPTTPVMNGKKSNADYSGVWSSQHNPMNRATSAASSYQTPQSTAPKPRYASGYNSNVNAPPAYNPSYAGYYRRAPSPTPSVVTQGDDGWWA